MNHLASRDTRRRFELRWISISSSFSHSSLHQPRLFATEIHRSLCIALRKGVGRRSNAVIARDLRLVDVAIRLPCVSRLMELPRS